MTHRRDTESAEVGPGGSVSGPKQDAPEGDGPERAGTEQQCGAVIVEPMSFPPVLGDRSSGFFDPADPRREADIKLHRVVVEDRELFDLMQPIGYWDQHDRGIVVPEDLSRFRSDLTSVPSLFTWLVPRTGAHLPAALIHDGLIHKEHEPQTYVADHTIDRHTADRILRDAMRDLGVSFVRRWLIWTGVTLATLWESRSLRYRLTLIATIGIIVVLGVLATVDLLSTRAILPWMGSRPLWLEFITGGIAALVIPALLSVTWYSWWRAGVISGIALALLLHVTIALVVVSSLFLAVEAAGQRRLAAAARHAGIAAAVAAAVILVVRWPIV